jgi:hypothetical protein
MEKISLPFFYQVGAQLNPLTKLTPDAKNRAAIFFTSFQVHSYVYSLLISSVGLKVCQLAGKQLIDAILEIQKWMSGKTPDKWVEADYAVDTKFNTVVNKAKEFETVLTAELQTLATYHVTQKGIYSTSDLVERAENILPGPVLSKISEGVKEEIRQSGRCLAFDSGTACAFHIMRAVEAVMHEYYIAMCKPKSDEKLENWGAYIAEFQKSPKAEVKEVVAILQQIKDQHRNRIMHPEINLTPDEAFTLFEIAHSAIVAMADKLPIPKKMKE